MARYSIFPFGCTKVPTGAFNLAQLSSCNIQTNSTKAVIIPGGAVDRAHVGLGAANPVLNMVTQDLDTFFTDISASTVLAFTSGKARLQQRDEDSTFKTSTDHDTYDMAKGVLVPRTLQAAQSDVEGAELQFDGLPLYDGTNKPIARSTGVDFSLVTAPAFVSRFFMGPIYINSVQVDNIERVSIDFGINYQRKGFNGSAYPTEGSIITRTPTITFTSTDVAIDAAVDLFARALAGTIAIYFQRGISSSDRVPVTTSTHLKVSATAGEWCTDTSNVQGNEDGSVSFTVMPTVALASSLSSAIP